MERNRRISAAVLAGGFSSRMGRDKAALPFGGSTMLAHQVQKLRALGITDVMISGSELGISGTRSVPDVYPHRGPLSGIHACLRAAEGDAVLFVSVDVPMVPADALQALLDAHAGGVTALRHGDKTEPLLAVYDAALAEACEAILQTEQTAVRRLLEQTDVKLLVRNDAESLYTNCNTETDYRRLCAMQEGT